MDDMQHDDRLTDSSPASRAEESAGQEGAAASVARLLANPRRIRRN
jgi:hypothetical protein